jgi:cellulase/cellobiase CelA1
MTKQLTRLALLIAVTRSLFATAIRRSSVFAACILVTACASIGTARPRAGVTPTHAVSVARPLRSRWPDPANYNAIIVAVKVRDQALHLKMWNEKAYAAQLALGTLVTLEGSMLPGRCARFVAHIYDELADLSQAHPGEDWQPMFDVVAHDPSAASQCAAPRTAHNGLKPMPARFSTPAILTG